MRNIFVLIWLISSLNVSGQHFPLYSQYMMNGLVLNPAYAGSRDVLSTCAMYRNQWVGFDGAPVTMTLSAHWPFQNRSVAAGVLVTNEKIGVVNNTSFFGNYAYRFRTGEGFLSLGLKAGFEMWRDNQSELIIQENEDLFNNNPGYFLPNFGLGIYYYNADLFAGASVPFILSYRQKSNGNGFKAYNDMSNYTYLLTGGFCFRLTDNLNLKPSALFRYLPSSPLQYDLNCNLILLKDGALWLGASYRNKEAMVGMVEFQLNTQIRLGYSYDYSLGPLSRYNNGSHEIMLRYEFRYIVNAVNPKFF